MDKTIAIQVFDALKEQGHDLGTIQQKLLTLPEEEREKFILLSADKLGIKRLSAKQAVEKDISTATFIQDEKDIAEASGRRFIPNSQEAKEFDAPASKLAGTAMTIADKAGFGIPSKIGAALAGVSDKEFDKAVDDSLADAKGLQFASTVAGYALNPAGIAIRSTIGAKTLGGFLLENIAETLAVEGGESILNIAQAAIQNPDTVKQKIKEEGINLGFNLGAAGVGTLVGAVISAPIKTFAKMAKPTIEKYANFARRWLDEDSALLIENAKTLSKVSAEELPTRVAQKLDDYKAILKQQLKGNEANLEFRTFIEQLDSKIDEAGLTLIKNIDDPKSSMEALVGLAENVKVAKDAISQKFGEHLDTLATLTKGKTAPAKEVLEQYIKVFELEGSLLRKGNKLVPASNSSAFKKGIALLNKLKNKKELTHRELGFIAESLQPAFRTKMNPDVASQAKFAYKQTKELFSSPEVWGDDAARLSSELYDQYFNASAAFSSFKRQSQKAVQGIDALKESPENFIGHLQDLTRQLETAQKSADLVSASSAFSGVLPPSLKKQLSLSLKATREQLSVAKAKDLGFARKTLKKIYDGKADFTKEEELILGALRSFEDQEKLLEDVAFRYKGVPNINRALVNPMIGTNRAGAVKWANQYAKELPEQVKRTIDASAKFHRIAKLEPGRIRPSMARKVLKDMIETEEIQAIKLFHEFTPEVKKALKNPKLIEALAKKNPKLWRTVATPNRTEISELTIGALAGGELLSGDITPESTLLFGALALYRIAKDPTSLRLFVEEMGEKAFTKAQIQTIMNGARISSVLAEEIQNGR